MGESTTLSVVSPTRVEDVDWTRSAPALVLVWSLDAPQRLGELLFPPLDGQPGIFGRGDRPGSSSRRLLLQRQRPGLIEPAGLLTTPAISREQLRLQLQAGGGLHVENLGKCPTLLNGRLCSQACLQPGDLLELQQQALLLCVNRGLRLAPVPAWMASAPPPFGEADQHGIVGESDAIWEVRRRLVTFAQRETHVLIRGESGTGKELAARALHTLSSRRARPLVARNAASLPASLIDAELFGNLKNYPNPGMPERPGLVGEAEGGTLLLDEFGELPEDMQAHLLRLLDGGEYHRLGESRGRKVHFVLVAATNRPLERLKSDVAARFELQLELPGLNQRQEDIPLLVHHLLRHRLAKKDPELLRRFFSGPGPASYPRISPELMTSLLQPSYTTHVRELTSLLWQAVDGSPGEVLTLPVQPALFRARPASAPEDLPPQAARSGLTNLTTRHPSLPPPVSAPLEAPIRADGGPPGQERPSEDRTAQDLASTGFSDRDLRRIAIFRRVGFAVSVAAQDPEYPPVSRSTADLHLRLWLYQLLLFNDFSIGQAAAQLAPGDPGSQRKLEDRLRHRLEQWQAVVQTQGEATLRQQLSRDYEGGYRRVEPVLNALLAGKIRP